MVFFDSDSSAPELCQVISGPDRQSNTSPGADHPQNRARHSAEHESGSQNSNTRCTIEDQHVARDLNHQYGDSRSGRFAFASGAGLDCADDPVDDEYDPGKLDQIAKNFFFTHLKGSRPAALPATIRGFLVWPRR